MKFKKKKYRFVKINGEFTLAPNVFRFELQKRVWFFWKQFDIVLSKIDDIKKLEEIYFDANGELKNTKK